MKSNDPNLKLIENFDKFIRIEKLSGIYFRIVIDRHDENNDFSPTWLQWQTESIVKQILEGLELYKRLAEFSEGIIKGMVHVMPEEKYLEMQKEIESRTTSIVHNENLRLVSELDELKKVMERNNNTFDSLHKERDALNVRVSRLLSENNKINSNLTVVEEKLKSSWAFTDKLKVENESKQKLLDEVFARVNKYQTEIVPELQQENESLKEMKDRLENYKTELSKYPSVNYHEIKKIDEILKGDSNS